MGKTKKTILAAVLLAGAAITSPASADLFNFTVSDGHGTGPFGTVTTTDLGGGTVKVEIDMTPNYIIEGGGDAHHALTFSTSLEGQITLLTSGFTVLDYTSPASYTNDPFKFFTWAIDGVGCEPAGEGGCGYTLDFTISNFGSFIPATQPFGGQSIFAAIDIFQLSTEQTFVVGLGVNPTPGQFSAVPGPIVGAGLPGLVAACMAMYGLARRRRRKLLA
jgi:hypothetical protein